MELIPYPPEAFQLPHQTLTALFHELRLYERIRIGSSQIARVHNDVAHRLRQNPQPSPLQHGEGCGPQKAMCCRSKARFIYAVAAASEASASGDASSESLPCEVARVAPNLVT